MSRWVNVVAATQVPLGGLKGVKVDSQEILLANVEGTLYAVQDRCPHLGWRLSRGKLDGRRVTCPGHGSQFDLVTGEVVRWATGMPSLLSGLNRRLRPPRPLKTYPVKAEDSNILVQI